MSRPLTLLWGLFALAVVTHGSSSVELAAPVATVTTTTTTSTMVPSPGATVLHTGPSVAIVASVLPRTATTTKLVASMAKVADSSAVLDARLDEEDEGELAQQEGWQNSFLAKLGTPEGFAAVACVFLAAVAFGASVAIVLSTRKRSRLLRAKGTPGNRNADIVLDIDE